MADALDDMTVEELQEKAREADLEGRSKMNRDELISALKDESSDSPDDSEASAPDPLRHTPGATTPKTGPVPSVTPTPVNITQRRYAGGRSVTRIRDRRRERIEEARSS